jgi:hypothetical protein
MVDEPAPPFLPGTSTIYMGKWLRPALLQCTDDPVKLNIITAILWFPGLKNMNSGYRIPSG